MAFVIVKSMQEGTREANNGRLYTAVRVSWDVVEGETLRSSWDSKREAVEAKIKLEQQSYADADAALSAAREALAQKNTAENRAAFQSAWATREAVAPKQRPPSKARDYSAAARSGKRQHAELRAKWRG